MQQEGTTHPRLSGQVAVITGAAQGLGEALAERLIREGCHVAVADLNEEGVNAVAERIDAMPFALDVADEDAVTAMMYEIVGHWGKIDILVANAGIVIAKPIEEMDYAAFMRVQAVNLGGYYTCARAAIPHMKRNGGGCIVQINSKSGKKGSAKNAAYAASKFAGIGLTQSLALELAADNIRVNAICPGNLLDSPLWTGSLYEQYGRNQNLTAAEVRAKYESQVPLGRGCTYEDIAGVMVFLASSDASYMTGQAINVTGGQQMT